jgi:hypothetical protein
MLERISRRERFDLLIAWGAISLAFSLIFKDNFELIRIFPDPIIRFIFSLLFSVVTVGIGFVVHEMAHKFTAMKYGYWAEFRKDNTMLLVAVALAALVGVVFAAPGATVIYNNGRFGGGLSREENGKISAAGPVTNLLLCIIALGQPCHAYWHDGAAGQCDDRRVQHAPGQRARRQKSVCMEQGRLCGPDHCSIRDTPSLILPVIIGNFFYHPLFQRMIIGLCRNA